MFNNQNNLKMKNPSKSYFIAIAMIMALSFIPGCGDNDDPELSAKDKQTELLAKKWSIKTDVNSVTLNGDDDTDNWPGFTVTFNSNGTYAASNISKERLNTVWSTSGTWSFKSDTNLNTIVRNDGVEINISVDEANLSMSFNYSKSNGRIAGIEGEWMFDMMVN